MTSQPLNETQFQYLSPGHQYEDTKANIEALVGVTLGAVAFATDTKQLGTFDGLTWAWGGSTPSASGVWNNRGSYDASGGAYPSTGGSGSGGAIVSGDAWIVSVKYSQMPTMQPVSVGDVLVALVDSATNTQADWLIIRNSIYQDFQSTIESITGSEGVLFYATDLHQFGFNNGTEWKWGVPMDEINLPKIPSGTLTTYLDLESDWTAKNSSGVIDPDYAYITAYPSSGPNYYGIAAGDGGYIRTTNDPNGLLKRTKWTGVGSQSLANPATGEVTVHFVGVSYNSGSPTVVVHSSYDWNFNTNFPLGVVTWDGTNLRIVNEPMIAGNTASLSNQNIRKTRGLQREQGMDNQDDLIISDVATRQLSVTSGILWRGLNSFSIAAIAAGTGFTTYYRRSGGGFNATSSVTQWSNTQYDDGSGTLATLTSGYYACGWVYVDLLGQLHYMFGRGEYASITEAQSETEPSTAPKNLLYQGCLLGRIIFQKGASSASLVESVWLENQTYVDVSQYNELVYGNGVDGSATLDGTNLYGWCKLISSNVYEMTRAAYLTDLNVSTGVTLRMSYPLFGKGTLTLDGKLDGSGGDASGSTAGSVAPNGWIVAGDAPAAGVTGGAADGNSPTTTNRILGGVGGRGAAAWVGPTTRKGRGAFGSNQQVVNSLGGKYLTRQWNNLLMKYFPSTLTALVQYQGGQPGGSGGKSATGTSLVSGAGGAGGGIVAVAFREISISATGSIDVSGGNGGNASGTGGSAGGGGGGGGGVLGILYDSLANSGTITAAGGTGGTSVALGTTPTKAVGTIFAQAQTNSFETNQAGTSGRLHRVSQTVSVGIGGAKNTLYLVAVLVNGTLSTPTVKGWGLTWSLITSIDYKTIASPTWRLCLFSAYGTPAVNSDTFGDYCVDILVDYPSSPTISNVVVLEIQNATGTIVQNATNRKDSGASGITVTLSAVASTNNAVIGVFGLDNWATRTPGSGFTLLADYAGLGSQYVVAEMSYNDTTVDITGSTPAAAGIAIEVSAVGSMESGTAGQDGEVIYFINKG